MVEDFDLARWGCGVRGAKGTASGKILATRRGYATLCELTAVRDQLSRLTDVQSVISAGFGRVVGKRNMLLVGPPVQEIVPAYIRLKTILAFVLLKFSRSR